MRKLLLWMMVALVAMASVTALSMSNAVWGSHFTGNANDDVYGVYSGTVSATLTKDKNDLANRAYNFTTNRANITYSNSSLLNPGNSFSISLWVFPNNTADYTLVGKHDSAAKTGFTIFHTSAWNGLYLQGSNGTSWGNIQLTGWNWNKNNSWNHLVFTYNNASGNASIYSNGALYASAITSKGGVKSSNTNFTLGINPEGGGGYFFSGRMDEPLLFNKSLNSSEVAELYLNYDNWEGTPNITSNISSVILDPENLNSYGKNLLNVNATCSSPNATFLMRQYVNGVLNYTNSSYLNNTNITRQVYFNDGEYNLTLNCSISMATYNQTTIKVYIDTIFPSMNTTFTSNRMFYNAGNLTAQFNLSDSFALYSINVTIDGKEYGSVNGIGSTSMSYNFSISLAELKPSLHSMKVKVADGHTKKELKDKYSIKQDKNKGDSLGFEWDNEKSVTIKVINGSKKDEFNTLKAEDRFNWTFRPENLKGSYTFEVKATDDITIMDAPETYLKKWLVFGETWLDFNLLNEDEQIDVSYIDKNTVWVTVSGIKEPSMQYYSSIGDLNIVEYNFTFFLVNASLAYYPIIFNGEANSFILTLNMTNLSVYSPMANLIWNGASMGGGNYSETGSNEGKFTNIFMNSTALQKVNFTYSFNISDFTGNYNITGNQTIFTFNLTTNCSPTNNVTAINLTIYNEENPLEQLNGTILIDSLFWKSTKANAGTFTTNLSGASSYILCLKANGTTGNYSLFMDMIVFNAVNGGFTHRNYYYNMTISENVTNISLYNFNHQENISELRVTTRKSIDYSYFPDAVVSLQHRYVSEGIWRTVQMGLTDEFGNTNFNILERTTDYKLLFYDTDNHLIYQSQRMQFSCDFALCSLIFKLSEWTQAMALPNLLLSSNYNNETKMITVQWEDTTFLTKSVWVKVSRMGTDTILCSKTVDAASGTIMCNMTGYTGDVLLNVYAEDPIPVLSEVIKLVQKYLSALDSIPKLDKALWSGGIIITVGIGGVLFGAVVGIIMTLVGIGGLVFLNLNSALTLTILIIMAILGIAIGINLRR